MYLIGQSFGHDASLDVDMPEDAHEGFSPLALLSIRGLLTFTMFMGYAGFATISAGFSVVPAIFAGLFAGFIASWLAYKLVRLLLKMQSSGTLDMQNAVGQTGTVHLVIPANASAHGKVMIVIQGSLREMDAISEEEAIPTGASVLVTSVTDNGQLVVMPYPEKN